MTVYVIYGFFPKDVFSELLKWNTVVAKFSYEERENEYCGIYAMTTVKKYAKRFIKEHRKEYFRMIEKEMNFASEEEFYERCYPYLLAIEDLTGPPEDKTSTASGRYLVLKSKSESYYTTDFFYDGELKFPVPMAFVSTIKPKYFDALEKLYYTTYLNSYELYDRLSYDETDRFDPDEFGAYTYPKGYTIFPEDNEISCYVMTYMNILSS